MGLQSTADEALVRVNRRAQLGMDERAVERISRSGFRRVNVDLVFGLPGQTLADWRADLLRVAALPIDSVTTYDCLYRGAGRGIRRMPARPTPDTLGAMYDLAHEMLTARWFHAPYGSVSFSRHGAETGTSPYFEGRLLDGLPYLGAGNYASTLVGACWAFAPLSVDAYVRSIDAGDVLPFQDVYVLPAEERWAKYILLALNFGVVDARRFRTFSGGVELETAFGPQLLHAVEVGWLRPLGDGSYGLVPGQFRAMPWIRALFYSREAVEWLARRHARIRPPHPQGTPSRHR